MLVPIFSTFLTVIVFLWIRQRRKKLQIFRDLGIPGPEPNLFFGNFLEIFLKDTLECQTEWIRKYGKVLGYYHGIRPVLLVTDTEMLRTIQIKEFQKFSDRPTIFQEDLSSDDIRQKDLIGLKGVNWKMVRSLITPTFTSKKMKLMSPIMQEAIDVLLEKLEAKCQTGEIFDAFELYRGLTMDVIGRTAFGIQTNVQKNPKDPMIKLSNIFIGEPFTYLFILITSSFPVFAPLFRLLRIMIGTIQNKFLNPLEEVEKRCEAIIRARLKDPSLKRVDLLQLMIDAEVKDSSRVEDEALIAGEDAENSQASKELENGSVNGTKNTKRLSIEEVVANTFLFFLAGYETTSTTLAFCTMLLVNFQDVQDKIRNEVDELIEKEGKFDYGSVQKLQYLENVLSEVLRLYPSVHLFVMREATEDVDIGRIRIRKGMAVQVPVYNLHRDPDYWPEPEKFIPERFSPESRSKNDPLAWQPFGAGPRNCVGMRFAQKEIKMALAEILRKYKFVRCHKTDTLPLDLDVQLLLLRPKYGVPVKIEHRGSNSVT